MDFHLPQTSVLASLGAAPYPPGTLGDAVLGTSFAISLAAPPYSFSPNGAGALAYNPSRPMTLEELYATPQYITPHDRVVQALKRTVRDLQEENEIAEYRRQIAELKAQLGQRDYQIAELEVRDAEWHALTEALLRKLYELHLLAPTCEACHINFNRKNEEGKIEVKANRNATVCSAKIGDPDCPTRRKAQEMYDRRAEQKEADQMALNDYESTGD